MPLTPAARTALCRLGRLPQTEQTGFLRQSSHLLTIRTIPPALEEMTEIQFGPLRMRPPAAGVAEDFFALARGIYALAVAKSQHEQCAAAAGALADFEQRFGEKLERDYWQLVQSLHSTLRYPAPKFGSTLDIIVSTSSNALTMLHDGQSEPPQLLSFLQRITHILVSQIKQQAVPELLKFIQIPHDARTTAVSLAFLCAVHLRGLDTRAAVPVIQSAAASPRDPRLPAVFDHALLILNSTNVPFERAFDQILPAWKY